MAAQYYPHVDPQYIAQWFYDQGYPDREIALLVSAHAGHWVYRRTIAGIRRGDFGYTGERLEPAFAALAYVWQIP
jgi:hypothetical protein